VFDMLCFIQGLVEMCLIFVFYSVFSRCVFDMLCFIQVLVEMCLNVGLRVYCVLKTPPGEIVTPIFR